MSLTRDLKLAVRHLLKSPGFSLTAVLMLTLGIGATTAIFSIVEGVLLRPLPFPHPNRLVVLSDTISGAEINGQSEAGVTGPDIVAYTRDTRSFAALGGYTFTTYELSGLGTPAQVMASRMSPGAFTALGVQPLLGRTFTQEEDQQRQQVALLSYSTWQSRFHGDPSIVGQKVLLDRKPFVVTGVMPRTFEFPLVPGQAMRVELWIPLSLRPEELSGGGAANWSYQMVGRLRDGVTAAEARDDANRVAQEIMRAYPAFMASLRIRPIVKGLHEDVITQAKPLVRTLFLAVAVVLLIACANLAGLLLVRAIRRRREVAVRLALGASGSTLLRQALLESLVLSVTGGIIGLVLAGVALKIGVTSLPETLPLISNIQLDWRVAVFALLLGIVTGIVSGVAPAFAAMHTSVNETLKEGGRTGTSGSGHARLRSGLVIAEIAVALILLAASGLLLRSFEKMREASLGYNPDHSLIASYSLPRKQYSTQLAVNTFNQELLRRLGALPGVESAGLTSFLPANGNQGNSAFVAEGYVPPTPGTIDLATPLEVQGDIFRAMGIPLLRGRLFTEADNQPNAQLVVVVNQEVAQQSWPGQDPIGKRMRIGTVDMQTPWATIVGEVAGMKEGSPDAAPRQQYYIPSERFEAFTGSLGNPATDLNGNGGYIVVRTAMPPQLMENQLRSTVKSLDPLLPLTQVQTMDHALSDSEAPRRFNTILISAFAAAAVLLAILGIYSVIAFTVAMRVHEMAIRMALGSQRGGIVGLVLTSGLKLAIAGCLIGLAGAIASTRLLSTLLYGVSALDPLVLTMAAIFVLGLAMLASFIPARRAAGIDPMQALRGE